MAKNVAFGVHGGPIIGYELKITVDLAQGFGLSTTGKSTIAAQTDNPRFEKFTLGDQEFMFNLTVIKKEGRRAG